MTRRSSRSSELRNARACADSRTPFDVYLRKHGACAICRERDTGLHHGAAFCRGNFRRQHPTCTHDQRQPRFAPDMSVIASLNDKAPS